MQADQDIKLMERKNWIMNTKVLYDFIASCNTPTQVLSLESLPLPLPKNLDGICHQFIATGSNAPEGEQNFIMIYRALLPSEALDEKLKCYSNCADYDGFPVPEIENEGICSQIAKIPHQGEVNRLKASSIDIGILATQNNSGLVTLYKLSNYEQTAQLNGSTEEGFGLNFYNDRPNVMGSFNDGTLKVWDLNSNSVTCEYKHGSGINSLVHTFENCIAAATEDGLLLFIDERCKSVVGKIENETGKIAINTIAATKFNSKLVATGSNTGDIHFWDIRNTSTPSYMIKAHESPIIRVEFNQHEKSILATASEDGTVQIFNMDNAGLELSDDDSEDCPEELVFNHTGHQDAITDFTWSCHDSTKYMVISAAQDETLQFWQPSKDALIYEGESDIPDSDVE
ncbi:histone-binding protein RBBP4 [Babesia microti strain RI]|uniref:Histone-binding protein RBBP4 n=1 Tax=Babesia microti (strain RI) TaxID=1133968 RepID=A0A1R4A9U8_BABMR|nr:histone-binding protein RBBP4 [Babesia microti strain RI]SJK85778.1 histone-binding protein RBBP4 [Babesia microti strain RI]|eukprot:XP_021338000.1 histone-binding protein RBBP4 [Babesia microti strain RI]